MKQRVAHASHWGAFVAEVENGRLVATQPFEHDPNPSPLTQAWPEMVYSPLRISQPHVRRGYLAHVQGGADQRAARGRDDYIPVSWDVALDLAAQALRQTRQTHGDQSLFGGSYGWSSAGRIHHARSALRRFLNAFGGGTFQWSNYSYGAADALVPHIVGASEAMNAPLTQLDEVAKHAKIVLAFGGIPSKNWAVQSGGSGAHAYEEHLGALIAAGVEVITVSPFGGDHPEGVAGRWLPIRPGTDTALMFALMRQIERDGGLDEAFLAKYTTGSVELRAYLRGENDGIDKGPEWAAPLTGISAAEIIALARKLAGQPVMATATWSLQRAEHGEQPFWALIALASMLGDIGKPGLGYGFGYGSMNGNGNAAYRTPVFGLPTLDQNNANPPIPVARVTDMLLNPGQSYEFNGKTHQYPFVDLIYWAGGNPFHHHQDLKRLSQGFRRVSHVIVNEIFWTPTACHADIVFPATTSLERDDYSGSSRDRFILAMPKAIEPVGEARDDYEIFRALSQCLGDETRFTEGKTAQDWLHEAWQKTQKSLHARNIAAPTFEEFWQKGHFELPQPKPHSQFSRFRADPVAVPLATPTGKIMLASQAVAGGHARWFAPSDWEQDKHGFHLLSPQPKMRLHSQLEASQISAREKVDGREKLRLNPADAARLGLKQGDEVDVFNEVGACIAIAWPDEAVLSGVVLLPTGAHYDPDEVGNDRNSNPNVLTKDRGTSVIGQGCAAQSCFVSLRKREVKAPPLQAHQPPVAKTA